jgi:glycosyltransferase involved in cell wall biosynthesis
LSIEISIIVCTRNRASSLTATLQSLARQTMDRGRYEVLVVDNASTDETAAVVAQAGTDNLRCLSEPKIGLSRARNTGVAAAAGDVVAFLDDDAIASEDWLAAIAACFAAHAPGAVTGNVQGLWEVERPSWLPDALLPYLSLVDWGDRAGALVRGQWLCGTNMALHRRALLDVGGFAEELGRIDEKLLGMEEVGVQRALERRGIPVRYDPALVVRHRVPASRVTPEWLERRAFWQGVSSALCERRCAGVLGARPWIHFAGFAGLLAARPWHLAGRGRAEGLEHRCTALMRAGYLLGWSGMVA